MRILGVDPGFERLGIAILEKNTSEKKYFNKTQNKEKILFSECFKTSVKLDFPERLLLIGKEIRNVIKKFKPDILAVETLFINTNQKTAMRVAEARGVLIYEASQKGLEILEISPLQIKMAITGYGRADKNQIIKMVRMLSDVKKDKESDDELDAIAIALTASSYKKF